MTFGKLYNHPHCPACHHLLDGFTSVDHDNKPKPGDITVCAYCSEVLQFTDSMHLVQASPEAIEQLGLLPLSRAQRQARAFNGKVTLAKKVREAMGGQQ